MQLTFVTSNTNNGACFFTECAVKQEQYPVPQKQEKWKVLKSMAPPLLAAALALSPICITPVSHAQTIDVQKGAALFRTTCIGCHDMGGNIIQPGATLFTKDLQRNGVDTEEEIYRVTYFGKGRMPGFGQNCTPRGQCTFGARLQDEDIKLLAEFVKLQADQDWTSNLSNE
ncbi:PREDICTED: cytochrome c6, chloroplastic isoform X1 [Fragaria vesca subsp. vesca]|uniref:cytochrome c6, chloroplastic isoform X1 n=2 Tax=Fragaria vesca subsp. vesca TaxID=101020 RepID=UPI0002C2E78C|nr:PREDICTED: cytochrome c6, chloroplastic isoform X1 [Fragaria vesca subsp. vesca]